MSEQESAVRTSQALQQAISELKLVDQKLSEIDGRWGVEALERRRALLYTAAETIAGTAHVAPKHDFKLHMLEAAVSAVSEHLRGKELVGPHGSARGDHVQMSDQVLRDLLVDLLVIARGEILADN